MEIGKLRVFRAVVDAGGLTRAAGLLGVTPGTVSKTLRQLEEQLGRTLFVREGRTLQPSREGRALYAASERLLVEYERLLRSLEVEEPGERPLRLASIEPFTTHTLGALLEARPGARPGAELGEPSIHVEEPGVGGIEQAVASLRADVGVTYVPRPHRELELRPVARIEFGVFGRREAFAQVPFAELPFAVPVATIHGAVTEQTTVDSWPPDRRRRVRYRLTSMESALELARRGRCVVFLPTFVAGLHNRTVRARYGLQRLGVPARFPSVRHRVYTVFVTERSDDPRLQRFGRALAEVIEQGAELVDER